MKINSRTIYRVYIIFFLGIGGISCKKDIKKAEAERIVAEWIGKKIALPADIQCTYLGRDTICPDPNTPYKVLLYTDSIGCTSCKLQLYKWSAMIKEADSIMADKVSFHFYFQPKDEKELKFLLKRDNFGQAVYIDNKSKLYAANKLPDNVSYQCFLLDKDNKVLLIGNPTLNHKIWDLYKQTITREEKTEQNNVIHTMIEAEQTEIELANLKARETASAVFTLKNTGEKPLLIKDISASCGCTVPQWNKDPVKPGNKTEIKVNATPDNPGHFRKTVTVYCNTKEGSIPLVVKSMVED
jgi:hypothetical protein